MLESKTQAARAAALAALVREPVRVGQTEHELVFTGPERSARGRNGWFVPLRAVVKRMPTSGPRRVWVEIHSKRPTCPAPMLLDLEFEDLQALGALLTRSVAQFMREAEGVTISPESRVDDYVRCEGADGAEAAEAYSLWRADLERVGAAIGQHWVHGGTAEINFTLTLRQCYEIGWSFTEQTLLKRCEYLLEHLEGFTGAEEGVYDRLQAEILALFRGWGAKDGYCPTRCADCRTERLDRDGAACPECGARCCRLEGEAAV